MYFEIHKSHTLTHHLEVLNTKPIQLVNNIFGYFFYDENGITCDSLGHKQLHNIPLGDLEKTGIEEAIRHTNDDLDVLEANVRILNELINFAEKLDVKVIFYTSPSYRTYQSHLNAKQLDTTTHIITTMSEHHPNVFYYNLMEDDDFTENDFHDATHMNDLGAKKLTLKLKHLAIQNGAIPTEAMPSRQ